MASVSLEPAGYGAPLTGDSTPDDRAPMHVAYLRHESAQLAELLTAAPSDEEAVDIARRATALVSGVRRRAQDAGVIEAFMREYDLSSEEGVLLMCVAEALLRIPDTETADRLIRDKLGDADWLAHKGQSDSTLVNASTWGLMLTGRLVQLSDATQREPSNAMKRLVARAGEPMIRLAVRQAMRIMGHQFVMGRDIREALQRSRRGSNADYRYSFDMLGEAALTARDAARYLQAYRSAIDAIGAAGPYADVFAAPSISIKLSALHPRYEFSQRARVRAELTPRVLELAQRARGHGIGFTIDAEEADRLDLSLDVIGDVFAHPSLDGWNGYGLAVQAYQKRAPALLDWLAVRAREAGRTMPVRLVKGAYWDAEVKRAQVDGMPGFPVFTRKPATDVSYLACARRMFAHGEAFYPMFATHNAHTIAAIHAFAKGAHFEFQRLHGMGADLYAEVVPVEALGVPCRVYAPVGSHEDLLPYLVRRLLENGANTSFVNKIADPDLPIALLIEDPFDNVRGFDCAPHPRIPLPRHLYGSGSQVTAADSAVGNHTIRNNSMGVNLANPSDLAALRAGILAAPKRYDAAPLVPGATIASDARKVKNPARPEDQVGAWQPADAATVDRALTNAVRAQPAWDAMPAASRAKIFEHAADLLEQRLPEFVALCTREAGKTLADGIAEVREAVDFCRYYAQEARANFGHPHALPGPTGESNTLRLHGRGVIACISPWNFPLAIFMGQVAAALLAGNSVLAKPAAQTTLIGFAAVKLLHEAGVPTDVLQFVPGDGSTVGAALTADPRTAGVVFTGSTDTARGINRSLAARDAPIAVLIAETGGQNALIADSSALPEQLVKDVMSSAFGSAGQRCSAARVLFVQSDIADKVIEMLSGAMDELVVGDPALLETDVGPVIDAASLQTLEEHAARMQREARLIKIAPVGASAGDGTFFAPRAFELRGLAQLEREVFGPVLHVIRWNAGDLDAVIDAINATGYGLTLGIHSRIDETIERISTRVRAGNCYVNRTMIGAVVGVQPFGGEGLSGTGPKAGGPHYLPRLATERVLTINTTAAGGNASLLTLDA